MRAWPSAANWRPRFWSEFHRGGIRAYRRRISDDTERSRNWLDRDGGEGALKRRIMDMGITKGVQIYVRKVAPLGDPVEVTVRGYELSLRKADADLIEVR